MRTNDDPLILSHPYQEVGEEPPEGYKVESFPGLLGLSRRAYSPIEDWLELDGKTEGGESFILIRMAGIGPEERIGLVPEQGYVWKD